MKCKTRIPTKLMRGDRSIPARQIEQDGVIFLNASAVNSDFDIANDPFGIDLDP